MEEPFQKVYEICRNMNTPGFRFLQKAMQEDPNDDSLEKSADTIRNMPDSNTKFVTYRSLLNPDLSTHPSYGKEVYIPDYMRASFTRLRLMSHQLRVETGRWSRTDRMRRVCQCDNTSVQDENHVLLLCPLSAQIRSEFRMLSFTSMKHLVGSEDVYNMCKFVHRVLKLYG